MAELRSCVEECILNQGSLNIDEEDENFGTRAKVVDRIDGVEGCSGPRVNVSRIRAQVSAYQEEKDPRYRGHKSRRRDALKEDIPQPKFALDRKILDLEASDTGVASGDSPSEPGTGSDEAESSDKPLDGFTFDASDFGHYGDEDEDGSDDDLEDGSEDEGVDEGQENEATHEDVQNKGDQQDNINLFTTTDQDRSVLKGQAVRNQVVLFDALFQSRIKMQKLLSACNQMPQSDTYDLFLKEDDPNYCKNLKEVRSQAKNLLSLLVDLQEFVLKQNPETQMTAQRKRSANDVGSEDTSKSIKVVGKRKKMKEFGEYLQDQHSSLASYRDQTLIRWQEKSRLLSVSSRKAKMAGFEVSPQEQLQKLLANKESLIRRTRVLSVARGNVVKVLGKPPDVQNLETEDPEIYDDSDFYSRLLEVVLKNKTSLSDDAVHTTKNFLQLQKIRKKAYKDQARRPTSGKTLSYEAMGKLQQYLAPSHFATMDDAAINMLFGSLFGSFEHTGSENKS